MTTAFAVKARPGRFWHDEMNAAAISRTWEPGQVIFHEGDHPAGVWIVRSGHVDLVFGARNGVVKPLRKVSQAQKVSQGQILGLSEAISGAHHHATAVAQSICETGFLSVAELRRLLEETPAAWFRVLRLLSLDLTQSWDSLRVISSR